MRYWGWFVAKLLLTGVGLWAMLRLVARQFPPEKDPLAPLNDGIRYLLCDLALLACFLLFAGALYLIVWDQRYRCRVCLRRLRMPISTGSRARILQFGIPGIEYICTYGHGTLHEDELYNGGLSGAEWTPHSDDIWAELCASGKGSDRP